MRPISKFLLVFFIITSIRADSSTPMLPIQFDKTCFRVDGNPFYLISGEFHYFRVPKKDWKSRMKLFRAAGGNCLTICVPWMLHEPVEGKFVFGGGDGVHDLEDFLKTAKETGLYIIAHPGPYKYSGLKGNGLPTWLSEKYPEIRAVDFEGKLFRNESVSCIHPLFLEKIKRWYDRVCPILAKYTIANGGPIAFVRLDNEPIGIQARFGSLDYNPVSMGFGKKEGRYPQFLWRKFGTVEKLNYDYGTQYTSFTQVKPPRPDGGTDEFEIRRRKDYFDFYLETAAEYAATLAKWIRANGIEVPLTENSANPQTNALFLETVSLMGTKSFLLGSGRYYNLGPDRVQNNPLSPYAVNVFSSLEMLRLMGLPPSVFEMPPDSDSERPLVNAEDAKVCCTTDLAFGMKGYNYIFTGGPNPPNSGATTDAYDFGTSVGARGEIRPLYNVHKDLAFFIRKRPWIAETGRESDCRFALDFEYPRSEYYWKNRGKYFLTDKDAWDFLLRGVLTSSLCAGLSPVFCDLGSDDWTADMKTPVVVVSSPSMSAAKQMRIVEFLKKGGKILLTPVVPILDERFNFCDVLQEFLGRPEADPFRADFSRVNFESIYDVPKSEVFVTKSLPAGARVLASEEFSKKPVAWILKTMGNGQVVFLGMRWMSGRREQEAMLRTILQKLGLRQKVVCSNPNVWTSWRSVGNKSILFILNLNPAPMETEIQCFRENADKAVLNRKYKLNPMEVKCVEIK